MGEPRYYVGAEHPALAFRLNIQPGGLLFRPVDLPHEADQQKWLKAGILEEDQSVQYPEEGTSQGGSISPILANIYLHHAINEWFEKEVKSHCKGEAIICRYADDFVCAFQYAEDAERFYRVLPKRLKKFNLEVAEEKTNKLRFSRFQPGLKNRFLLSEL
ncbi:MAG: reverse transcriptase domain-containing protein [Sedimenticola sp.]